MIVLRIPAAYTDEQVSLVNQAIDGCIANDWLYTASALAAAVRDEHPRSAMAYAEDIVKRLPATVMTPEEY